MQKENISFTDPFDASAYAFAAVMAEAVANMVLTHADAEHLSDRMGEVMDHLMAGKHVMAGRNTDGSFTLELLVD